MEFIQVAKIINSHGIKGAVKIYLLTSNVNRFNNDCKFYIDKKIEVSIKNIRKIDDNIAILEFNEYDNINQILQFKNLGIYVEESDLDELSDGEYYIYKLVGLTVYNQFNEEIGKISNVLSTLANDVYEVNNNGKIIYIPAVSNFINEIDIENGIMRVNIIEGMIDD